MSKTYGIISDLHCTNLQIISLAIDILKQEEINALVLNGDLIGDQTTYHPQDYLATILNYAGESDLETYVLPGSHEEFHLFEPVVDHFSKKFNNIINTSDYQKVEQNDHHLIFLPGSDWRTGDAVNHGYSVEELNGSGIYKHKDQYIRVFNLHDLKKLVTEPDKTILFSHIPRRFSNPETGVDTAEFYEAQQPFQLNHKPVDVGSIFPKIVGDQLSKQGAPLQFKRENRGNEILQKLYTELGVTKNITGHFHESAGKAHDSYGNPLEEGLFVSHLFYNASCLDRLMIGMVTIDNNKVAYENIDLRNYSN
ncbi:metallophosphoesterase [Candidatus Woesearchaeota archaeon]|nr:metallophosphoesterase [Candidatus Woesearchaeota archaeon]